MGICDCGQETVWNDMCSDCNDRYEDMIFGYEEKSAKTKLYQSPKLSKIFESKPLAILIDLEQVVTIRGMYGQKENNTEYFMVQCSHLSQVLELRVMSTFTREDLYSEFERLKEQWKLVKAEF